MSEPTREQRDEAKRIVYGLPPSPADYRLEAALLAIIQQRDALKAIHEPMHIVGRAEDCPQCWYRARYQEWSEQADALKAENERLKRCHSEEHVCCNEVGALKAELAKMQMLASELQQDWADESEEYVKRAEAAEARVTQLQEQIEKQAKELKSLRTDVASEQLIAVRAEERRDEAQRKLEGLAEAQRQLNCDRDVELTNLRASVGQLQGEISCHYASPQHPYNPPGSGACGKCKSCIEERLAEVERERDQYRVLANMAECEMQQARARVSKLEGALRNLISHHKHPPMKCGPGVGECDEVRAARRLIDEPTEDELYRETPEPH